MRKILALSIVFILALVLSGCSVKLSQPATLPTLNVNGSAEVTLAPDIAYISIGVHTENSDANLAVSGNTTQAQKVIDALKAAGVDVKDIRTNNYSVTPQQQTDNKGTITGILFVVDNTVYVTLRDLTKIGDILGAATEAGANSIYGIQFDVADKTIALASARKTAVDNARTQAQELAQAAGVTLGSVQSINYSNNYPVPAVMDASRSVGMSSPAASVPVTPGQLTFTVDVNIVYAIQQSK